MFLNLNHKKLTIYSKMQDLNKEIYSISKCLPADERFNMVSQIRRASLSVILNFSEGSTRKSVLDRIRFYTICKGSIVELDAAIETAINMGILKPEQLGNVGKLLNECFAMLSKIMEVTKSQNTTK